MNKQELMQALVKADAAGNTEDARVLAGMITKLGTPEPAAVEYDDAPPFIDPPRTVDEYRGRPGMAFARNVADAASFGFNDEISGGAQAMLDMISGKDGPGYAAYRDAERESLAGLSESNPGAAMGGQVAGALIPGTGVVGASTKMAGKMVPMTRTTTAAGLGGTAGGMEAAGRTEADVGTPEFLADVAGGASLGAVLGPMADNAAELVGKGVKPVADWVDKTVSKGASQKKVRSLIDANLKRADTIAENKFKRNHALLDETTSLGSTKKLAVQDVEKTRGKLSKYIDDDAPIPMDETKAYELMDELDSLENVVNDIDIKRSILDDEVKSNKEWLKAHNVYSNHLLDQKKNIKKLDTTELDKSILELKTLSRNINESVKDSKTATTIAGGDIESLLKDPTAGGLSMDMMKDFRGGIVPEIRDLLSGPRKVGRNYEAGGGAGYAGRGGGFPGRFGPIAVPAALGVALGPAAGVAAMGGQIAAKNVDPGDAAQLLRLFGKKSTDALTGSLDSVAGKTAATAGSVGMKTQQEHLSRGTNEMSKEQSVQEYLKQQNDPKARDKARKR